MTSAPPQRRGTPAVAAFSVLAGNLAVMALNLVTGVVAARLLGPGSRGELVAGQTLAIVLGLVLTLGVPQAVVVVRDPPRRLLPSILALLVMGALVTFLVGVGLRGTGTFPWLTPAGAAGMAAFCVNSISAPVTAGWTQRQGRMAVQFQVIRIMPGLAIIAAMLVLHFQGRSDANLWLLGGGVAAACVSTAQLVVILLRDPEGPRTLRWSAPSAEFLRGAAVAWVLAAGSQFLWQGDTLVVALRLPSDLVAYFAVATGACLAITTAANAAGMTAFSQLRVAGAHERMPIVRRAMIQAVAVSTAAATVAGLLSRPLVELVYGSGFAPASQTVAVLVFAAIPLSLNYLFVHAVLVLGGRRRVLTTYLGVGLLYFPALLVATTWESTIAVACVDLATYSVAAGATWRILRRLSQQQSSPAPPVPAA